MPIAQSKEKQSTDDILKYFFDLFEKTGFEIFKLLCVEFALSVVKVKLETIF